MIAFAVTPRAESSPASSPGLEPVWSSVSCSPTCGACGNIAPLQKVIRSHRRSLPPSAKSRQNDGSRLATLGAVTYYSSAAAIPTLQPMLPMKNTSAIFFPDAIAERSRNLSWFLVLQADALGVQPSVPRSGRSACGQAFRGAKMGRFQRLAVIAGRLCSHHWQRFEAGARKMTKIILCVVSCGVSRLCLVSRRQPGSTGSSAIKVEVHLVEVYATRARP